MDARKRFMNQREMMLLYSQLGPAATPALIDLGGVAADSTATNVAGNVGSEGYFSAVEKRRKLTYWWCFRRFIRYSYERISIQSSWHSTKKELLLSTLCT